MRTYTPGKEFKEIYRKLVRKGALNCPEQTLWPMDLVMGAFEVYFMGVKVYSKL